ncbi:MAG: pantoate--beta-alanine ligase [Bacteroidales bacterium]|nr:pantoate--beta-alanine ligase [Bacteroidales bacterium]MDD4684764.1 pantoate--beta-alanine ligase [Bacteroidales bacterium]
MRTIEHIYELSEYIENIRQEGKSIGLVPTMGALHSGHISLIETARKENDIIVCSVFVNPIQFNNKEDLMKYPRDIERDRKLLEENGCDVLFCPLAEEVYPEEAKESFSFGKLEEVMEGAQRPGHFNGVAIIVSRLFDWVRPHKAYFGEKDYQQLAIIKDMVSQLNSPVEIVACPIVREEDGLAISSRNVRLSEKAREIAPRIHQILKKSSSMKNDVSISQIKSFVVNEFKLVKDFELEYFEIVDDKTLQPIIKKGDNGVVGCIAVWLDGVRLIDIVRYY